jgi:hypothetical protein
MPMLLLLLMPPLLLLLMPMLLLLLLPMITAPSYGLGPPKTRFAC